MVKYSISKAGHIRPTVYLSLVPTASGRRAVHTTQGHMGGRGGGRCTQEQSEWPGAQESRLCRFKSEECPLVLTEPRDWLLWIIPWAGRNQQELCLVCLIRRADQLEDFIHGSRVRKELAIRPFQALLAPDVKAIHRSNSRSDTNRAFFFPL